MNPIVNKIRDKMKLPKPIPKTLFSPAGPRLRGADAEKEPKSRLPDLSLFEAVYDAETKRWSGSLRVPHQGSGPAGPSVTIIQVPEGADDVMFTAEASALVKLCFKLDDLYRAWLIAKSAG